MRHLDFFFVAAFALGAGLVGCATSSVGVRPVPSEEPVLLVKDGATAEAVRGSTSRQGRRRTRWTCSATRARRGTSVFPKGDLDDGHTKAMLSLMQRVQ